MMCSLLRTQMTEISDFWSSRNISIYFLKNANVLNSVLFGGCGGSYDSKTNCFKNRFESKYLKKLNN